MPRLSLVMITAHGAPGPGRGLEGARALADEVHVGGAPEAEALLARCTGDWVLWLGAEEVLDRADHGRLREALEGPWDAFRVRHTRHLDSGVGLSLEGPALQRGEAPGPGGGRSHLRESTPLRLFRRELPLRPEGLGLAGAAAGPPSAGFRLGPLAVEVRELGWEDRTPAGLASRLEAARGAAEAHPEQASAQAELLEAALEAEHWEIARTAAEALGSLTPAGEPRAAYGSALALQGLGLHAEALAALEGATPGPARLAAEAESLWRLGRVEEAQARFSEALLADPGFSRTYLRLAGLLEGEGLWEDARLVLEAGLDQNPRDRVLWEVLVGHGQARKDARAVRDAWNALQQVPEGGDGAWHLQVVQVLIGRNEIQAARDVVRRGLGVFPRHEGLLALQARMGLGSGAHRALR